MNGDNACASVYPSPTRRVPAPLTCSRPDPPGGRRRLQLGVDDQHLRPRRPDRARGGGQPGAGDRIGHRGRARLSPAPGSPGAAGADRSCRGRRPPDPRHRVVPQDRDRGHVRVQLRPAREIHARISLHPDAAARAAAGQVHRRNAARQHRSLGAVRRDGYLSCSPRSPPRCCALRANGPKARCSG